MNSRSTISTILVLGLFANGVVMVGLQDDIKPGPRQQFVDTTASPKMRQAASIAVQRGIDSTFIRRLLSMPQTGFDSQCVRINVTNFAQRPDYSHNYNDMSVRTVRTFIAEHDSLLRACEERFNVPKEVVASLLWVESKYGKVLGKHHLPSVYLSVLLCAEPEYITKNMMTVQTGASLDSTTADSVRRVIEHRAQRKVAWATEQLRALNAIDRNGTLDIASLYGSWAGAFGLTQFLPSSYVRWAVDANGDGTIDLYDLDDAVFSVANYLRTNGWGPSVEQQRKAVYHYNNSNAYVDAVLTLASKVELPSR